MKQSRLSESEYLVLNDSSFWDITFDRLTAENIQLISNNALGKSAKTIKSIQIGVGNVNHQPPEYNVWKFLSSLVNLEDISIDLNITEITSHAFIPLTLS